MGAGSSGRLQLEHQQTARPPATTMRSSSADTASCGYQRGFHQWVSAHSVTREAAGDVLQGAVLLTELCKGFRPVLPLVLFFVAILAAAAWRRLAPAAYGRWREGPAAALRIAVYAVCAFWRGLERFLDNELTVASVWAHGPWVNALALAALVWLTTLTAGNLALVLFRPTRLWLSATIQLITVGLCLRQNGGLCHTATLQHAEAERLLGAAYHCLRWLLLLTPLPLSLALEHEALGRCQCVLGYAEVVLGFWLPLALAACMESRAFVRWQQECSGARKEEEGREEQEGSPLARMQPDSPGSSGVAGSPPGQEGRSGVQAKRQPEEGKPRSQEPQPVQGQGQQGQGQQQEQRRGSDPLGQRLQRQLYAVVNALLDGTDICGWALLPMTLAVSWDVLVALTPIVAV